MIPTSTATPSRFTPESYVEKESAPVYLVKAPTYRDVIEFHKELTLAGARYPANSELAEALNSGIADLGDDYASFKETIDRYGAGIKLEGEEGVRLEGVINALRNVEYQPLLQLLAAREKYIGLSAIIAAQMFLVGWENVEFLYERKLNRVPDALLQKLPLEDVIAIGNHARTLMQPTAEQTKN